MYRFRDFYIPEYMMDGIIRYVEHKAIPGSFLEAVICNDLRSAVETADDENLRNLPAFVAYFYNETPYQCWGSRDNFRRWLERDTIGCEGD